MSLVLSFPFDSVSDFDTPRKIDSFPRSDMVHQNQNKTEKQNNKSRLQNQDQIVDKTRQDKTRSYIYNNIHLVDKIKSTNLWKNQDTYKTQYTFIQDHSSIMHEMRRGTLWNSATIYVYRIKKTSILPVLKDYPGRYLTKRPFESIPYGHLSI